MGDNFFTRLWRFFRGYVTITVEGFFLEKFTNLCVVNKLPFWNVRRFGSAKMTGRTTASGFKKMRHQARKCGCRISLDNKKGTPFFLFRYRKRKLFAVGILIFFFVLRIANLFVWSIEISGNESNIETELISQIEGIGIKPGILKKNIDSKKIANQIMIKRDDLSWVGVYTDGMRLKVKVVEKVMVPEKIDESEYCDIVAGKAGLIADMNTYKGTAKVQVGDIVDKGQILVSGFVEMAKRPEESHYVHSLADIRARVWYEREIVSKLSPLREKEQVTDFAYKVACDKIYRVMPSDSEIINITKNIVYTEDTVRVRVTLEALEDIGEKSVI